MRLESLPPGQHDAGPAGCRRCGIKGAIRAFWQSAFDMGIRTAERITIEVEGYDDFAFEVWSYVLRGVDGGILDRGKYLVVWKQDDGEWKYHRDIWKGCLLIQGR